jgi:hypothetical protein
VTKASVHLEVAEATAIDYYSLFREVCAIVILNDLTRVKLGGPGRVVEIDESLVSKRKYERGKILARSNLWVVGGIERETRRTFACPVRRRNKPTLFTLISHFVAKG